MAMLEEMDVLLRQWGMERAAPSWEAPVRSPLGDTDQWMGGGRATGGASGIGPVVAYAEHSRIYQVIDEVLRSLCDPREEGGLGGRGLVLYTLAKVRYVHAGAQPSVSAQIAELKVSERTYRAQVAELHQAVAMRMRAAIKARGKALLKEAAA